MKKIIDRASWQRREHFEFFSSLDEPFHGIVAEVDCSAAWLHSRQHGVSFFLMYLYACLRALNAVPEMRTRTDGDQIVEYRQIHANATIMRPDHSFAFCAIDYAPEFRQFCQHAQQQMQQVMDAQGLCFNDSSKRIDAIHFSAMPWLRFSGVTHARQHNGPDSVPKISVGKCCENNGRYSMPVAVFVHHGLADGFHIHLFLQAFEQQLTQLAAELAAELPV